MSIFHFRIPMIQVMKNEFCVSDAKIESSSQNECQHQNQDSIHRGPCFVSSEIWNVFSITISWNLEGPSLHLLPATWSGKRSITPELPFFGKQKMCVIVYLAAYTGYLMPHVGNTRIKQTRQFKYLGSVLTKDGKCDTEIRKLIGMAKVAFQKLDRVLRDRRISLTTK